MSKFEKFIEQVGLGLLQGMIINAILIFLIWLAIMTFPVKHEHDKNGNKIFYHNGRQVIVLPVTNKK